MNALILLNNSKIGKCAHCMRVAAGVALASAILVAIATITHAPQFVTMVLAMLAAILAAILAVNWLAHIAAFTYRNRQVPGDIEPTRRVALAWAVKAAAIGIAASIPVATLSTKALAFCGQCTKNSDCGVGWVCKNTAPVNSGKVCNECVAE